MNNKEIELRISDLFAMLLKAAKLILCLMLILGILGGAYGAYSVLKAAPEITAEDVKKAEDKVKSAEKNVTKAEKELVRRNEREIPDAERNLERSRLLVQRRQEYLDNSIYYAMNPFERGVSRLTFYVETDFTAEPEVAGLVEDPRNTIVLAYAQLYPFDPEIMDHVRTIMKTDADRQYIEEMISVSTISNRFVRIQVLHENAEVAEKVVNYLYETMLNRLKGAVAEHSANVLNTFTGYEVDWAMNDNHTANEDSLLAAQRAVTSGEESLAELQAGVADKEQAVEDAKEKLADAKKQLTDTRNAFEGTKPNVKNVLKKAGKYGAIGLFAGLVAGCAIALLRGLFGGKIENQSEVMNRYAFPLIGVLPRTKKVWFDKAIRRLEGEPVGNFEATAEATAQSLLARVGERSVCLVSTGSRPVAEKLASYTKDRIKVLGSIIDDAESVRELADYEGIILVEQRGKSRRDLVDAEVLRAEALNKEILGIVLA